MTNEKYCNLAETCCPMCESTAIEGGFIEVRGNEAFQNVYCNDCAAEWTDCYKLDRYEVINKGSSQNRVASAPENATALIGEVVNVMDNPDTHSFSGAVEDVKHTETGEVLLVVKDQDDEVWDIEWQYVEKEDDVDHQ